MRLCLLLAALGAFASGAEAQQLDFKRVSRSGDELLSYRWRDHDRHEHNVAFTLTRQAIREAETSFAEFSMVGMWQVVEENLRDEVARFGNGARIVVKRTASGVTWTLEARAADLPELNRKVEARLKRSERDYLTRHLRRMVGPQRVIVDFAAATSALQGPLRAVTRALGDVPDVPNEDRARVALALGFFQEIPYALLDDRQRQGGDFLPAPALLAQNRGDCDSKAVALAAVLRSFTRFRKLAVVTMPGHAILAVEMPAEPGDTTVRQGGRSYVALEPAGPALLPVGKVGATASKYLAGLARAIEIWPVEEAMQRLLAAIVHADLAGFTRLMEGAETRTFRHLKAAQNEVWRPAIETGGGRLVGTAGDAMLAEFGSAVAAVNAAIDIQERMVRFNAALGEQQRMLFRIGVHMGEVIVDQEDQNIFGDGVNLAARIQGIAEPGGIAVSRSVRDVTELRIDYAYVDGGDHSFKNVSRPVHVFHVRPAHAPRGVVRLEGIDSSGQPHVCEIAVNKLGEGAVVGRAAGQCDLVVAHATVSRRHARLSLVGDTLRIEDLGSTNGTSVDGKPVRPGFPVAAEPGSTIRLGDVKLAVQQD